MMRLLEKVAWIFQFSNLAKSEYLPVKTESGLVELGQTRRIAEFGLAN